MVVFVVTAAVVILGCSGGSFDREQAITNAIQESGNRMTREQAECYVDRVHSELGTSALEPGATIPFERRSRLVTIRVDCVGVANLGTTPPATVNDQHETATTFVDRGPQRLGDDPELDVLYNACAEGWGKACDDLYEAAPIGSEYEAFAGSCGGRTHEIRCYDIYPSPGVTLPSEAQPTTTAAPAAP